MNSFQLLRPMASYKFVSYFIFDFFHLSKNSILLFFVCTIILCSFTEVSKNRIYWYSSVILRLLLIIISVFLLPRAILLYFCTTCSIPSQICCCNCCGWSLSIKSSASTLYLKGKKDISAPSHIPQSELLSEYTVQLPFSVPDYLHRYTHLSSD